MDLFFFGNYVLWAYGRHLLGEDLGPLNIDEIEHLEHQLDTSLKHIRSTRVSSFSHIS